MKRRATLVTLLMMVLLFALNVYLNAPLFRDGSQPYSGSIESGYAGISRFFAEYPNPWGWNPRIYCGLPAHHTYLPGVPYLVASVMWMKPDWSSLHAYRAVTATFACLGPVTLFLLILYASGSRLWALLGAVAYTFCSPSYDLFQAIDKDRGLLPIPWRLHVMVKYGEGPHNAGLTLLPLALIGVMHAARTRGFRMLLAAALGLAMVALTHWIAAFALAIVCSLMLLAYRGDETFRHRRVVGAGVLAYGLALFWLTPTFVSTVGFNWPKDAFNYKLAGQERLALILIAIGVLLIRWLFKEEAQYRYLCLVTMCFFIFAALAEGYYAHGLDAIPESRRYALEMELFLVLALAEWMRVGWNAGGSVNRFCVLLVALLLVAQGSPQARRFASAGYASWTLRTQSETLEYRMGEWLADQKPAGRVYLTGGLRFRFNSWFDVPQTHGTFESGVLNRTPLNWDYGIRSLAGMPPGTEAQDSITMLQAMGTEFVLLHGTKSEEYYRDVKNPDRFEGVLEKVRDDGDDRIYRVPFGSMAHILFEGETAPSWETVSLTRFVAAIKDKQRPHLQVEWEGNNRLRIYGGAVPKEGSVSLLMSYDPGWSAKQGDHPVEVLRDPIGYIQLKPRPDSQAAFVLDYQPGWERRLAALVSFCVWVWALLKAWNDRQRAFVK